MHSKIYLYIKTREPVFSRKMIQFLVKGRMLILTWGGYKAVTVPLESQGRESGWNSALLNATKTKPNPNQNA
jgi:hypothetical protein